MNFLLKCGSKHDCRKKMFIRFNVRVTEINSNCTNYLSIRYILKTVFYINYINCTYTHEHKKLTYIHTK